MRFDAMKPFFRLLSIVLFTLYTCTPKLYAQYSFRHLTNRNGLIQGSVYYFLEDKSGYIWMSTQAGLNRFDGQVLKSFIHDESDSTSISKGEVRGLSEAPNGDIWMGTGLALSRYVRKTNRFENFYAKDKKGKKILTNHQAVYADDSTVWYLNSLEGLVRMNYRTGSKQVIHADAGFTHELRTDIAHFDPKTLSVWLSLASGILLYDSRSGTKKYFFTGRADDVFKEKLIVYGLFSKDGKTIWLSTNIGLVELRGGQFEIHQVGIDMSTNLVFSMDMTKNGNLWLSTSKSGLIIYSPAKRTVHRRVINNPLMENTLASDHVSKVFVDNSDMIWANVDPIGVDIIFSSGRIAEKYQDNVLNPNDFNKAAIRGICEDSNGSLWVGTSGEGLRRMTRQGVIKRFGPESGAPQESVRGIISDKEKNVWIAARNGLFVLPAGRHKFRTLAIEGDDLAKSNYIKGIIQTDQGHYLIATMAGIYGYDGRKIKLLSAQDAFSGSMYYDKKQKELFAGRTGRGFRCYRFSGDTLIPRYDRLSGHGVMHILPDTIIHKTSLLWLGTDNGLIKLDRNTGKVLRTFSIKDGLPDKMIYSVMKANDGSLWMSTNRGLARMSRKEEFQSIRHTEEIEFNSYASLKAEDGSLYFGAAQGLFHLSPESLAKASSRGLRLFGLWVNDSIYHHILNPGDRNHLHFRHYENNLIFELAALDYSASVDPVFEYRRVRPGGKSRWIKNGSDPLVRFQNLPPDSYHFEFRALDANGFYTASQNVVITIYPPFWQRWWFIALICLATTGALSWAVRLYIRKQQLIQQKLTGRVIAALESERLRIAMDIHDDVNNTLAAAKGYIQNVVENDKGVSSKSAEYSRDLIQKATEDLRNITHDLMPVKFDLYNLPDVVEQRVQEWNEESGIHFTYILAGSFFKLRPESELMIYRIVTEIVNNIKKHSKATRSIVQLVYQEKFLVLSIEDNGVGFDWSEKSENRTRGIGLKNIYSRAGYLKADFQVSSDKNGVLVHLTIPYAYNTANSGSSGRRPSFV